jgi:hypothetical protein
LIARFIRSCALLNAVIEGPVSPATPFVSRVVALVKYSLVAAIVYSLPPNQRSCATASTMCPMSLRHLTSPVRNVPAFSAGRLLRLPAVIAAVAIPARVVIADLTFAQLFVF